MSILRALFLFGALATFPSCHAATPEKSPPQVTAPHEREAISKSHPTPVPTAPTFTPTPSITPSPTPTAIATSPGPLLFGPIEMHVQPIEVQPPKGELHVTASGIPEKITLASDVKSIPFDLRWPKDPLNISIDLKNGSAGPKDSEFQKVIDTFSQLNRDCKEQLSELNKKLADAERKNNDLQKTIDNSNKQNNDCEQQLIDLNNKLTGARGELAKEKEEHRKDLESFFKAGALSKEKFDEKIKELESRPRDYKPSQGIIVFGVIIAGMLGGGAAYVIRLARLKRADRKREADVSGTGAPATTSKSPTANQATPTEWGEDFGASVCLGIIAAFMVPGFLDILSIAGFRAISEKQIPLVYLWSLCFVAATLGEPFIESVSSGLLRLVNVFFDGAVLKANTWMVKTASKAGRTDDDQHS